MKRVWILLLATVVFSLKLSSFCKKRPDANETAKPAASELSEEVIYGKKLYTQNGCHACHGPEGRGDGPAGRVLKPPPRDYRDMKAYKQGASLEEIMNTLAKGVPGTTMAPYPHIKEADRKAIASYVIYLQQKK